MSSPESRRTIPAASSLAHRTKIDQSEARMGTASIPTSTGQGLARNPSFRQTRPLRKSGGRTSSSFLDQDTDDEEAKALNAQLISDLKDQVHRAEQVSDQYRKQLEIMQKRLDDATAEQTDSEERDFQRQTEVDRLRAEVRDAIRQRRELELSHESERRLLLQERERQEAKEAESQDIIQRLNETLRVKQSSGAISPPPTSTMTMRRNTNDLDDRIDDLVQTIQIKDEILDTLKLELAEAHIKLAELEHEGNGQFQTLEKEILDVKMYNARLLEENESFQMLLSEKTLKGDFSADVRGLEDTTGMSSLADELALAGDDSDIHTDTIRRLEAENRSLREGNKALTLYVDKIIGRLLQHEGFEHIITDKDEPPQPPAKALTTEKALPVTPPKPTNDALPPAAAGAGFLHRAKSVVSRTGPRPRPMSVISPPYGTTNENPETAPSIPLNRGHRRTRSDQQQADAAPSTHAGVGAAVVVQQMNRGSPLRTTSGGPLSPRITPLGQNRMSYFPPSTQSNPIGRPASRSGTSQDRGSSANSVTSDQSGEHESYDGASSQTGHPPSIQSTTTNSNMGPSIPGAVMKQNQLRPLRLVQEKKAIDEEQKRANRSSWMGWFKGNPAEGAHADRQE